MFEMTYEQRGTSSGDDAVTEPAANAAQRQPQQPST
jgi:hypothetical protein